MRQYVVDAFADEVFHGNPAAVCLLDSWLSDELMTNIARENNLSETAFTLNDGGKCLLRWFTPGGEIDLCGHATLATAFVLFRFTDPDAQKLVFSTKSGELTVTRQKDGLLETAFPAFELRKTPVTRAMTDALGAEPKEAYMGRDLLCVYDEEETVRNLTPDMTKLVALEGALVHATARGKDTDCVSRSFAPKYKIAEDPVCGSGHCHIAPYWARRLGKSELVAYQASERGGFLYCRVVGDKVFLSGRAALFSEGSVCLERVAAEDLTPETLQKRR